MKNYNSKSLENLKPNFKPKWKNRKTKLVRIPVVLESDVLAYAHTLDDGKTSIVTTDIFESLKVILDKVENNVNGYKRNNAGQLIRDLKSLIENS